MSAPGVHRIIERQAATRGDHPAIIDAGATVTYSELNQRANTLARTLISRGLRRGSHVVVNLERSAHLAIALLAVLKAGAAYMWTGSSARGAKGATDTFLIDEESLVDAAPRWTPNLPIITRPADTACILPQRNRMPGVLVPHATIAALQAHPVPEQALWTGDPGAMDLWLPLMAGATVTIAAAASAAASPETVAA